jgi:TolB protein
MLTFSRILCFVAGIAALPAFAATPSKTGKSATPPREVAQQKRKVGEVVVTGASTIGVRIRASSPEMQQLADLAFESHGRYSRVSSGQIYDIRFTSVAPTQVRVDVSKGSAATPVISQVVAGNSARNALLRAADVAVEATNGQNLRGFFTGRLAFIIQKGGNRGDVYASDLFWGEAKQFTHHNALTLSPRWSPDGSRIVYTSYFRTGAPDIFAIDTNTARVDTFVSFRGMNTGARFSPTGQQVAMVLSGEGTPEIYVSNAQGRQVARRTRSDAVKSSPVWSPDGSRIVFVMDPGPQLYVMSAAGGAPQRLSSGYSYTAEPDWSTTNPSKIACTVRDGGRYQIAVYDFSKGSAQVVSKAAFDGIEPSWLADGRHLVYTARDRNTSVLCILDTETGKSTPISARDKQTVQASVWTPAK